MKDKDDWEEVKYKCSGFTPKILSGTFEILPGTPLYEALDKLTKEEIEELFKDEEE